MIMKTVQKGTDKIDHVEYGDNVIYFYSSKNRNGRTNTVKISKRITGRIMKDYTDNEYNTLLETVIKSTGEAVNRPPSTKKPSCRSCPKNGICNGVRSCSANFE